LHCLKKICYNKVAPEFFVVFVQHNYNNIVDSVGIKQMLALVRFFCYTSYMLNKMQSVNKMQNTKVLQTAKYKIVVNKKLNTVRIVAAFNIYNNASITQRNAAYVSGDLLREDVDSTLAVVAQKLNANLVQVD
jgi:hypothetical protein